jgi:lipoprotein NlpD
VTSAGSTPSAVSGDGVRREPKGGKLVYSEQAWAQAQKPEAPVVLAKVDPKPEAKPEPVKQEDKKVEPAKPANGDDKIDWGWPASGKIIAGFNETSSKGVDLSGKPGDPVLAAASGRVVYAGTGLRGYGKLVIVKHDNSYLSAYAHNQNLLVKEGQAVSRGQKIAELGDTDSDRPKLHFEIRRQGKPVDPGKYLPPR